MSDETLDRPTGAILAKIEEGELDGFVLDHLWNAVGRRRKILQGIAPCPYCGELLERDKYGQSPVHIHDGIEYRAAPRVEKAQDAS